MDMQNVCVEVFSDLSDLIVRRSNVLGCGEMVPEELVNIEIEMHTFTNTGVLAAASANYLPTVGAVGANPTRKNAVYYALNGSPLTGGPNHAGRVQISTSPTILWNFDLVGNPTVGTHDFYSVFLHEALHILGFAGTALENGEPNGSGYEFWDQHLYFADQFDANDNPLNLTQIINNSTSDCSLDDWNLEGLSSTEWENGVLSNCTVGQDMRIYIGESGIAPIAGNNGNSFNGFFPNLTSHLNPTCGGVDYVMQRSIGEITDNGDGTFNEIRRTVTAPEIEILCELGYQISPDMGGCDGCYTTAMSENALVFLNQDYDCCNEFRMVCEGETLEIPFDDLLCNDFSNGVVSIGEASLAGSTTSSLSFTPSSLILDAGSVGVERITYTVLTDCGCTTATGRLEVYVNNCIDCSELSQCENIACPNDFENISTPTTVSFYPYYTNNMFFGYQNSFQNTVRICEGTNTNFVWIHYDPNDNQPKEGLLIELNEPISPNCQVDFSLDLLPLDDGELSIQAANLPPCHANDALISPDCDEVVDCGDYEFVTHCISNNITFASGGYPLPPALDCGPLPIEEAETYSVEGWVNNTDTDINYLIISPRNTAGDMGSVRIAVDNIEVTTYCVNADFTHTTNCYTIAASATDANPDYTYAWTFGDGNSGSGQNVSHTYINTGTYEVTLIVTDECGIEETSSQIVNINVPIIDGAFNIDASVCEQLTVWPVNPAGTHTWNFGDGSGDITGNQPITHTYASSGNYLITHTADNGCGDVLSETIQVTILPCGNPPLECCPAGAVSITANMTVAQAIAAGLLVPEANAATVPQQVYIENTLTVNDVYQFAPGSEICFAPGAAIELANDAQFKAEDTYFHGCEEMWQGMLMNNNGFIALKDCTVEGAENAVRTWTSAFLHLNNNTFHRNLVSILQPPGSDTFQLGQFHSNDFNCTGATLPLPYPGQTTTVGTHSYAALELNEGVIFLNNADNPINIISDMANGIVSEVGGVYNVGTNIQNIQPDGAYVIDGHGVYVKSNGASLYQYGLNTGGSSAFNNCYIAVRTIGTNTRVVGNDMTNVETGILVQNGSSRYLRIDNNTVACTREGIILEQCDLANTFFVRDNDVELIGTQTGKIGIGIFEMGFGQFNSDVSNNTVDVLNFGSTGIRIVGGTEHNIVDNLVNLNNHGLCGGIVFDGGGWSNLTCNEVNGAQNAYQVGIAALSAEGIAFADNTVNTANVGMRFSGDCNKTMLETTTFDSNGVGLQMTNSALFGSANDANAQAHTGNVWLGSFSNIRAQHMTTNQEWIELSQFIVHTPEGTIYHPENETGLPASSDIEWFVLDESGTPETIGACMPGFTDDDHISELDKLIARDSALVDVFPAEVLRTAQKELYRRLKEKPQLINEDPDVAAFYAEKAQETMGQLTDIDISGKALNEVDASTKGQISSLKTQVESYRDQISQLKTTLPAEPTTVQLADFRAAQALLYDAVAGLEAQIDLLYQTIRSDKNLEADGIKGVNSGINVTEIIQENDKIVNDIYLSVVARGQLDFTALQSSQLWLIAAQCPLSGGKSVFKARGLYRLIDRYADFGDDFDICNAGGILLNQTHDNGDENATIAQSKLSNEEAATVVNETASTDSYVLRVNPNPTTGLVRLTWTDDATATADAVLFNAQGVQLRSFVCRNQSVTDVSGLSAGVYWFRLKLTDGQLLTTKVVITR